MILVLFLGGSLGWVAHRGRVVREAVLAIRQAGGHAYYSFEWSNHTTPEPASGALPREPGWLARHVGPEYVETVVRVDNSPRLPLPFGPGPEPPPFSGQPASFPVWKNWPWATRRSAPRGLDGLRRASDLRKLSMYDCDVDMSALFSTIRELRRLERLQVLANPVGDAELAKLEGKTSLRRLSCGGPALTDQGLASLGGLRNLKELIVSGEKITDASMTHLGGLRQLEVLYLGETSVTGTGLAHLKGLKRLKVLGLAETRVHTLAGVENLDGLECLDLRNAPVGDEAIRNIAGLARLKELTSPTSAWPNWLACVLSPGSHYGGLA